MDIRVLGAVAVSGDDGSDRTPRGQRARDLLAVMLLRRERGVPPDVLLDVVWGSEAHQLDISVVHTQMARLRRAIGADAIITTPTGYQLAAASTDADQFLDLVTRARRTDDRLQAIALLEGARELWRGPVPYADVSDGIASAEAARLREARIAAEEQLAEALLAVPGRDHALRAREVALEVLEREPLREHAHELALLAAARLDEQAEALQLYDRLRRVLRDELGVDPGRSIQQLHARVLAQDPELLLPRAWGEPAGARPTLPPVPAGRLIGRTDELTRLLDAVATRRVVTVTGHGGVGKTRLVLGVADELMSSRDLCFVDVSTVDTEDVDAVTRAVADAWGHSSATNPDSLAHTIGDRSLLVIIDEAEQCLRAVVELVATLTAACPGITFLVTSRTSLDVVGEARIPLGPLPVPPEGADLDEIRQSPAVALLLERLVDQSPDLVLDGDDLGLVAEFTRRLDGIPLAIELVAGYAGSHALGEIDELLGSPLDLSTAHVGRPQRHRSLRQALRWTYDRLAPERSKVLRRLCVFVGPFDLPAVRQVIGTDCGSPAEIDEIVRALARESLIQVDRQRGELRFRLLTTVRELMLELTASTDDLGALQARHRGWYASPQVAGGSASVMAHVHQHYRDYLAALDSAVTARDAPATLSLLLRLGPWWEAKEMEAPGRRWTTRALDEVPLDPSAEARVRALRGSLLAHADPVAGRADMLAALPRLELDEDGDGLLLTHAALALELTTSGELDQALTHASAAVAAARRWVPGRLAVALAIQAAVAVEQDRDLAERVAGEAFDLLLSTDVGDDTPPVAANVGWSLFGLGRHADGLTVVQRGIAAVPEATVPTYLTIHLGWGLLLNGDPTGGLGCFVQALEGETECETRWHADVLTASGCALAALGHPSAAPVLAGADLLVERTGHVLAQWQRETVARARDGVRAAPWTVRPSISGVEIADLVRSAAWHPHQASPIII